jgi:hypothetical protein
MRAHGGRIEAHNIPGSRSKEAVGTPAGLEMQLWWPAAGSAARDPAPAVRSS